MLVVLEELLKVLPPKSTSMTAADSNIQLNRGASGGPSLLAAAASGIKEAWLEVLLVVLAALCYFLLLGGGRSLLRREPGRQRSKAARASAVKLGTRVVKLDARVDDREVHRFVESTIRRGGRCGPEALRQYGALTCGPRRAELWRHLQEAFSAKALYAALLNCCARGTSLPPAGGASLAGAGGTASISAARAWASQLLADMRSFGVPRDRELYTGTLRLFASRGQAEDALWLYDVMVADGLPPDREALVCLLHAAVSQGLDHRALFFFREAARLGKPSMRTCMTLLRIFTQNQDCAGALALLGDIKVAGAKPDALVLNGVLGLCISASQLEEAGNVLRQWEESADTISFNILLKGYAQQADLQSAESLLGKMLSAGPEPNIITFNTVLDCIVRRMQACSFSLCSSSGGRGQLRSSAGAGNGELASLALRPWELLERLLARGLQPDRYTCSTVVKGMHLAGCSGYHVDQAVELLRRIGPEGLHAPLAGASKAAAAAIGAGPTMLEHSSNGRLAEVIFNTLLDACASLQDLDRMAQIFKMMEEFSVAISAVTFGTLIKAFGQAKHLEHCREVWQRMRAVGVAPTVVTFGCYIDACVRAGDLVAAEGALGAMRDEGVQPNAVVYTSLIRGFAQAKQPSRALKWYNAMREEGVEATAVTFNTVLNALAVQFPDPQTLKDIVDDMRRMNIPPDVVTYSILIKASCNAGHLDRALALLRELRGHGLTADGVAFNTLLLACSRAERIADAEEVFAEMRSTGVEPTHVTASILVKMYGQAKMLDRAAEVSEQIECEYGRTPNLHVYTCLIRACVQNQQVRRSWELFNKMLRAGIQPDAITYGTMIHGCIYYNKFDVAMELVRHAHMLPPPKEAMSARGEHSPLALSELQLRRPVPLQPEVLRSLHAALRRKLQSALVMELEEAGIAGPLVRSVGASATASRNLVSAAVQ